MTRSMSRSTARRPARAGFTLLVCLLAALAAGCGDEPDAEPSRRAQPPAVQALGVYEYDSEGSERIGGPLPGRHAYPPITTITVDKAGCQLTERWDALPERWTEWRYCVTGGSWRLRGVTDHHEFFGRAERYSYLCSGRPVPRPAEIERGFRWADQCRATGTTAVARGLVVAIEPVVVAGSREEAVHLRVRTSLAGRIRGAYTMDSWLRRADGLLLRRTFRSATSVDSIVKDVPDRERYSLRLHSSQPG